MFKEEVIGLCPKCDRPNLINIKDVCGCYPADETKDSSRSPGCYFVDLEDMKCSLVERIKLMEPDDGEEWHDETAHEISRRVGTFFDDEIFDREQTK